MTADEVGRECGDCALCCTVHGIPGTTRPYEPCEFLRSGVVTVVDVQAGEGGVDFAPSYHPQAGCGIYDKRPRMCRMWFCGWRLGIGTEDERPDRVGVISNLAFGRVRLVFGPESLFPDRKRLRAWALKFAKRIEKGGGGLTVVRPIGKISSLIGGYDSRMREQDARRRLRRQRRRHDQ